MLRIRRSELFKRIYGRNSTWIGKQPPGEIHEMSQGQLTAIEENQERRRELHDFEKEEDARFRITASNPASWSVAEIHSPQLDAARATLQEAGPEEVRAVVNTFTRNHPGLAGWMIDTGASSDVVPESGTQRLLRQARLERERLEATRAAAPDSDEEMRDLEDVPTNEHDLLAAHKPGLIAFCGRRAHYRQDSSRAISPSKVSILTTSCRNARRSSPAFTTTGQHMA